MGNDERVVVETRFEGRGRDIPFLLNYAVMVQIGGPIETMHITATFPDQGSDTANEQQAIVRAKQLARIFINSR
jgi:hypothetical protein